MSTRFGRFGSGHPDLVPYQAFPASDGYFIVACLTHRAAGFRLPDETPGAGPLVGILSALLHSGAGRILVVGCDMPLLNPGLLRFVASLPSEADAVIPRWTASSGKIQLETLHSIYSAACVEPVHSRLWPPGPRAGPSR